MACPHGSNISHLHQLLAFGCLARKCPLKVAFIINLSAFGWLARIGPQLAAFINNFSAFGWLARMGKPLAAFINFRSLDVLPVRVHQRSHLSLISQHLDGLPHWYTINRLY